MSYRWCPAIHVIFGDVVSVPLMASIALQSAVLALVSIRSPEAYGTFFVVRLNTTRNLLSKGVVVVVGAAVGLVGLGGVGKEYG